jgi:hypothetical protein
MSVSSGYYRTLHISTVQHHTLLTTTSSPQPTRKERVWLNSVKAKDNGEHNTDAKLIKGRLLRIKMNTYFSSIVFRRGITHPFSSRSRYSRCVHSYLPSMGRGSGRPNHGSYTDTHILPETKMILQRLEKMASGALCDSDKAHRQLALTSDQPELREYEGLRLMCTTSMKLRNPIQRYQINDNDGSLARTNVMVGIGRTVQLTRPNDFLGVLYGLSETRSRDVLVVNTAGSTRAGRLLLVICSFIKNNLNITQPISH